MERIRRGRRSMTVKPAHDRLTRDEGRRVLDLAREIALDQRALRQDWSARLRAARTVAIPDGEDFEPGSGLAPGGGFRLRPADLAQLGDTAKAFFADAVTRDGWTYLRGFRYYAADAEMYLPGRVPSAVRRWGLIQSGWPRYAEHAAKLAEEAAVTPVPWGRWLAWLAFLESVLNDLCAAAWSAEHLRDRSAAPRVDVAVRAVSRLLAEAGWHLWNEPHRARPDTWAERAHAVVADPDLAAALRGIEAAIGTESPPSWAVRAIREGDCLWQIAAAYELRWPALRAAHPGQPVLLLSEAFGAMSVGPLWAALMSEEDVKSVESAACRLSVHEEEMGRVSGSGWRTERVEAMGRVVVHLDDSVFTGRTHAALRGVLDGGPTAVYLASLTFDVGTPFNHPEEITALGRNVNEHLDLIEELVRAPGGNLPSAMSLWARRKRHGVHDPSEQGAFARVLGGSDRLLALLWDRYAMEIRHA
ncbi:hypothetical protein OG562_22225 [Streptomyces sp. NBC_01275]|uniref:hypothetical protein n=1 Tax=Streptomyces sp. NBC_01275 TaxID=2903807 RepID=UPI002259F141|nr:hypothetical protein [Streptomyces sp. NBC_01275]MCX4763629.1 hypothetical protein [Streptomyces sp. NBC_01275]